MVNVNKIKTAMIEKGIRQNDLAEMMGVGQSAVSKWLTKNEEIRNEIPTHKLAELCDILGIRVDDVFDYSAPHMFIERLEKASKYKTDHNIPRQMGSELLIPFVDVYAGAGAEGTMPDFISSEKMRVNIQFIIGVDPKNLSIMQVFGDSMYPTISPDEYVFIDMVNGREFYQVDGIYLINKDGSIQIKRLQFRGNKGIDIISDNKQYKTENTIDDGIDLFIIGKLFKQVKSLGALAEKK